MNEEEEFLPVEMYLEAMEADASGACWAENPVDLEPPEIEPVPVEAYQE